MRFNVNVVVKVLNYCNLIFWVFCLLGFELCLV